MPDTSQPVRSETSSVDRLHGATAAPPTFRWIICALLFLATTINYMDRQVLGLLAPLLQKKIGWDDLQYGHMVIAFQAAYAIGLLGVGYVIDRWGTKRGYSLAIIIWSFAACLHGFARNVATFTGARFLLGIGESGNFPSAIKVVAEWFDESERAFATGLFNTGSNAGAIFAPVLVPWIAVTFGWQAAFISLGIAGFIWVVLWWILYPAAGRRTAGQAAPIAPTPAREPAEVPASPPDGILSESPPQMSTSSRILRLIQMPQTWGFIVISAMGQPVGWFFLYWLPKFFSTQYKLDIVNIGPPLVIVYSMAILGGIAGGALPKAMLKRGWSLNVSRKGSLAICAALMIPVAFATKAPNVWVATALIGLGMAALQGWAANCYTVVSDLFPKEAIASVVGIGTFFGSMAGIAYAEFAGQVLEKSHNYFILFVLAGIACPVGILSLHLLVPAWRRAFAEEQIA